MNAKPMEKRASVFSPLAFPRRCNSRQANIKELRIFAGGGATTICTQIETGHRQSFFLRERNLPRKPSHRIALKFWETKQQQHPKNASLFCFESKALLPRFNLVGVFSWALSQRAHFLRFIQELHGTGG